jgi:hypothetical protein
VEPTLIQKLGLDKEFIETSQTIGIVRNGKIRTFYMKDVLSSIKTGILTIPG